jgi:hypothetical protein
LPRASLARLYIFEKVQLACMSNSFRSPRAPILQCCSLSFLCISQTYHFEYGPEIWAIKIGYLWQSLTQQWGGSGVWDPCHSSYIFKCFLTVYHEPNRLPCPNPIAAVLGASSSLPDTLP